MGQGGGMVRSARGAPPVPAATADRAQRHFSSHAPGSTPAPKKRSGLRRIVVAGGTHGAPRRLAALARARVLAANFAESSPALGKGATRSQAGIFQTSAGDVRLQIAQGGRFSEGILAFGGATSRLFRSRWSFTAVASRASATEKCEVLSDLQISLPFRKSRA